MFEFVIGLFLEIFFSFICYYTGEIIIFIFSFGKRKVRPGKTKIRQTFQKKGKRTNRSIFSKPDKMEISALIGLIFWIALISWFFYWTKR